MATVDQHLRYQVAQGWEQLPAGWEHPDVVGVAVDSAVRVFALNRSEHSVIVYQPDGTFVRSWGEGHFTPRTHGITIGPDDSVYVTDDGAQAIYKYTPDGERLLTLGTPGQASDTGYDGATVPSITRGGPPFNRPTNLSVAANGDLYVSDGYGNARVHRFSADGALLQSWGEPGGGPGEFRTPHGVCALRDRRVLVADRENDRIQIVSPEGEYLAEWTDVQRPTAICQSQDGLVYVSELWWMAGSTSYRRGKIEHDEFGRVSVYTVDGQVVARWGGQADPCAPGNFCAPHGLCVDSQGDVYVGEVTYTFAAQHDIVPRDCHMFQKFTRVR